TRASTGRSPRPMLRRRRVAPRSPKSTFAVRTELRRYSRRRCGILRGRKHVRLFQMWQSRPRPPSAYDSRGNAMLRRVLTGVAVAGLIGLATSAASAQTKDIRWGTPPVGTAGHKAMVTLSAIINKEMPQYRISVLPTAGAIATVKGFATKELEGFYGSDVAYHELATDTSRFKGFKARVQQMPVQSFWSNTIEVGFAVHSRNKDKIKKWGDLNGKRVFTGPLPFDTRAQAERALSMLGIKFTYVQVDLAA